MSRFRTFLADQSGAAAAEFALVSVLFLALMVGTIDMSRLLWEVNSAKASTRAAVRLAAVIEPAATELVDYDAVTELGMAGGSPVTAADVGTYTCTADGCTCTGAGECGSTALNDDAFAEIVAAMQGYYSRIEPENVVIEYRPVGIGFAGNPYGPDVEPLITVSVTDIELSPGVLQAFGLDPFDLPRVASSISSEDLS